MTVTLLPVAGLPEVRPGDDVAALIGRCAQLRDGDVVVVSQKVVSKAEGALVRPAPGVEPAAARRDVARSQAVAVVVETPDVLIVRTPHGLVCANAGVDASNVADGLLSLLPEDPDASARRLRDRFAAAGVDVAVVISDTFGRPWRVGQTDVAIGVAGLRPLRDDRGTVDRFGSPLDVTEPAIADEVAAAADLVRTKASGVPVVIVRGLRYGRSDTARATELVRDPALDLFARGRGMLADALAEPWPAAWAEGISSDALRRVRRVAPATVVEAVGPPGRVRPGDDLAVGLAAAVLADLGLRVRWTGAPGDRVLEAGRAPAPG